jgi:hypothetical protein
MRWIDREDYREHSLSESRLANRLQDRQAMENTNDDYHYRF